MRVGPQIKRLVHQRGHPTLACRASCPLGPPFHGCSGDGDRLDRETGFACAAGTPTLKGKEVSSVTRARARYLCGDIDPHPGVLPPLARSPPPSHRPYFASGYLESLKGGWGALFVSPYSVTMLIHQPNRAKPGLGPGQDETTIRNPRNTTRRGRRCVSVPELALVPWRSSGRAVNLVHQLCPGYPRRGRTVPLVWKRHHEHWRAWVPRLE